MSFVEGKPLSDLWWEEQTTEEMRLEALTKVAKCMAELHRVSFPEVGMLSVDSDASSPSMGPIIQRELHQDLEAENPFEWHDGIWGVNYQDGPYQGYKPYLLEAWDNIEFPSLRAECDKYLWHMAIKAIPEYLDGPYFISPNDFDLQNILVDDAGDIAAIIDWDVVATKPSGFGCGAYPLWILRETGILSRTTGMNLVP